MTASARVRNNAIIIKIPLSCHREEGFRLFIEMAKKIINKMESKPKDMDAAPIEFHDNQDVSVMGRAYHISVKEGLSSKVSSARLDGNTLTINLAGIIDEKKKEEHVSNLARRIISRSLLPDICKRISELNEKHLNVQFKKVFIKEHISRWGSCSENGNLNLNFRLLFAPPEVLDYVIIHELSHMKESNHSPAFWNIVQGAVPNYKHIIKWLRDNGNKLSPMFEANMSNAVSPSADL